MSQSPANGAVEDDDDMEEIEMTPAQLYQKLREAWQNEQFAPDLLPHQTEIVDCMIDQISGMEENIKRVDKSSMRAAVHKMEIDRIRYILASYLRCRLKKIENFYVSLLQRDEVNYRGNLEMRMSPAERQFCISYKASVDDHLKSLLTRMPGNMQNLEDSKIAVHPNLHQHVFLRVVRESEDVLVSHVVEQETREGTVELKPGQQHIVPFKFVSAPLADGSVILI